MGSNDFFKKKREKPAGRKKETREVRPNSFLIVSEGTKTEPLYFEGLAQHIREKYGNRIDVEKPLIESKGEGKSTVRLVEAATKIASRASIIYNQIWVVFDKDEFPDFDEAVDLANEREFNSAWSNQSFEYWLYLHFHYSDVAQDRSGWSDKLTEIFKKQGISKGEYDKAEPDIFKIVTTYGNLKKAINHASRIEKNYKADAKPSLCDPCTKVHKLILEFEPWIADLLQ